MTDLRFEEVFKEYFTPLSNIAYSVLRDEDTAKDIVQQVFINLWQKKEKLEIKGSIKSYLHRAVVNTSLNHIEKYKKLTLVDSINEQKLVDETSETKLSDDKIELEVKKAIDELPPKCNMVFSLSRFSGLKNQEIADHLGISTKAVEKHIGKALKSLRVSLKPVYSSLFIILIIILINIKVGFLGFLLSY